MNNERCPECDDPIIGKGPGWCPLCAYGQARAEVTSEIVRKLRERAKKTREDMRDVARVLPEHAERFLHDAAGDDATASWIEAGCPS